MPGSSPRLPLLSFCSRGLLVSSLRSHWLSGTIFRAINRRRAVSSFRDQGSPGFSSISFRGSNTSLQVFRFQKSFSKPGGSLFSNPRLCLSPPLFASLLRCFPNFYVHSRPVSAPSASRSRVPPGIGWALKLPQAVSRVTRY